MRYLATNVRIYKGTNSRGEYHYLSMSLFNDVNPKANPNRLPTYYILQELTVNEFLKHTDALKENPGGWLDVDMSKIPDEGLTAHHLDDLNREEVALDGWYQPCYTRTFTDSKGITHTKGTPRIGTNGQVAPMVNTLRVIVQYFETETFENGQKVKRWIPVDTAKEIARVILERNYIKLNTPALGGPIAVEEEPELDEEDKEAKRKALEEQLKALS